VPLVAPLRPLLNLTEGRGAITRAYRLMGGAPKPLVKWAFQLSSFQKLVTKPVALAANLDDADFLAQVEAVDRFTDNMIAYPGRTFGQLYHRFVKGNAMRTGELELGARSIRIADIKVPVLVFAGATDGIAPVAAVKAVVPLLTGSPEVRFEIVPGGHLGMLTGRASRGTTWRVMDEWVTQWSSAEKPVARKAAKPRKKPVAKKAAPAKKAVAKKAAAKKAPVKKSTAKKAAAKKPAPVADTIGVNPTRRYGSAGSRSLAR
jgi:poly[(R)-3-hydroxyalkanoate] polymerase subunit PhaC